MGDRPPLRGRAAAREPVPPPLPREKASDIMPEPTSSSPLQRFLGGPPARVALQLLLISLAVGLVLTTLRIEPLEIIYWLRQSLQEFLDYLRWAGIDVVESLVRWLAVGAVVVVPVWLVMRLLRYRQRR